jgi:cysteine-rich repeat protein
MVTPGWQCRVPGKKCVPLCGDCVITGSENCDDANAMSGDGCSSTCLTEPGASCPAAGQPCAKSECGNGMPEVGETCDKGAENGLFYGDATGCSKTCTSEPTCRDAAGVTQACSTFCGDGNIDNGETCDDGNQNDNDGCSKACQEEGGFTCTAEARPDTVDCPSSPGTPLEAPALAALAVAAAEIVDLNLAGTALDDAGLKAIGALPAATHLRLARNRLTDGALADLAALPALAYLNLYGNAGITDGGIAALAASRTLRELFVWQTAVSPDGAARLREQRPGLVVDLGTAATAAQ